MLPLTVKSSFPYPTPGKSNFFKVFTILQLNVFFSFFKPSSTHIYINLCNRVLLHPRLFSFLKPRHFFHVNGFLILNPCNLHNRDYFHVNALNFLNPATLATSATSATATFFTSTFFFQFLTPQPSQPLQLQLFLRPRFSFRF